MNSQIEKKNHYNLLYGYYQGLLTEKQRLLFNSYYGEDYSLAEIAEEQGISRNAVWDTLKKVMVILDHYESILRLANKDKQLANYLNELEKKADKETLEIINKIREME